MSAKRAFAWVAFWTTLAAIFGLGVYYLEGSQKAMEFFAGYVIELSLSIDNLFLFLCIFSMFGIPAQYQRRVLNYGIAGAIVFRLIFIVLGVAVVQRFSWLLYIFGAVLIYTGIKMAFGMEHQIDPKNSGLIRFLKRFVPVTDELHGEKFFVKINGIRYATPLFAIIFLIEGTDIMFAIDSIPAIFAVTLDPFIIYTSNIFAIMGLRSWYFVLEKVQSMFRFVKYGVGFILTFTGIKLLLLVIDYHVPIWLSLTIISSLLFGSIIVSWWYNKKYPFVPPPCPVDLETEPKK